MIRYCSSLEWRRTAQLLVRRRLAQASLHRARNLDTSWHMMQPILHQHQQTSWSQLHCQHRCHQQSWSQLHCPHRRHQQTSWSHCPHCRHQQASWLQLRFSHRRHQQAAFRRSDCETKTRLTRARSDLSILSVESWGGHLFTPSPKTRRVEAADTPLLEHPDTPGSVLSYASSLCDKTAGLLQDRYTKLNK